MVACHGDHAGKAHLTIRSREGAPELAIRNMPFEVDAADTVGEEQARILAKAARLAREVAAFIEAEAAHAHGWPLASGDGQAPRAFGQPIERR